MISEEVFWRQNGFLGWPFAVFGGSWVSIGPSWGFPEGLLVDLGSPLRSSVRPCVVFEGQLETVLRDNLTSHPIACFSKYGVPLTREPHFHALGLHFGCQNMSRTNPWHGA